MKGFSTIEILIAMAFAIMSLSALYVVAGQHQSALTNGETELHAALRAYALIQKETLLGREDFAEATSSLTIDGPYQEQVSIETLPDFIEKKVTATVTWLGDRGEELSQQMSALIGNPDDTDTCSSVLSGDWLHPHMTTFDFGKDLVGDSSSIYPISGIDIRNHLLYLTVRSTSVATGKDFFILDITNPASIQLLGSLDTNVSVKTALSGVAVAGAYAYLANAQHSDLSCSNTDGKNASCAQLQIVSVVNPAAPSVLYNFKVPGVTGTSNQGVGNVVYYHDGFVYLGLSKTGSGPEFNIIDVRNPAAPHYLGGFQVGRGISAIQVRNRYAYIASDDNARELLILDVHDPSHLFQTGLFDSPGAVNFGLGNTLAIAGKKVYLGRTFVGNAPEFYILDAKDPTQLALEGSLEIGTSLDHITIRDNLAFLLTNTQFQIWDITDPSNIISYAPALYLPAVGTVADCEGSMTIAGSVDATNKGYLSILTPAP